MDDMITKGEGNSRFLKTSLAPGTPWEEALAQMIAGTFPVDFNGLNNAGILQQGTALNKANLLSDATASAIGSVSTPNEALAGLMGKISLINSAGYLKIITSGTYVGGGGTSKNIPITDASKIVIVSGSLSYEGSFTHLMVLIRPQTAYRNAGAGSDVTVKWYTNNVGVSGASATSAMNQSSSNYWYCSIG